MTGFILPAPNHRTAVMGRTGSGKTVLALFLLSRSDFHQRPHYILDYKGDTEIANIDRAHEISIDERPPRHPGLYVTRPLPRQDAAVETWLERVYSGPGDCLIYYDEAYMVPDEQFFPALLTQGRSKGIGSIVLTQRPAWISRFVFSEANQYAVFHLNDSDDRRRVRRFLPEHRIMRQRLPDYHSLWYDVDRNNLMPLAPVPHPDVIVDSIQQRLKPRRVAI